MSKEHECCGWMGWAEMAGLTTVEPEAAPATPAAQTAEPGVKIDTVMMITDATDNHLKPKDPAVHPGPRRSSRARGRRAQRDVPGRLEARGLGPVAGRPAAATRRKDL